MVSEKNGRRYTPRFKFQVVMEILSGTKAMRRKARRLILMSTAQRLGLIVRRCSAVKPSRSGNSPRRGKRNPSCRRHVEAQDPAGYRVEGRYRRGRCGTPSGLLHRPEDEGAGRWARSRKAAMISG